ncbi:uncharacterized protein LOC34620524 [Cyclospora cayetanensis]|uniref:Uncharacterized protein LOC34620524 n=1 Tax=Cyclospora cayetanensis TaxID=88456 RepID=A0A6P6RRM0_9EIME|nr:uncharacterized protein LOC34620524 [Cyclospora cayetanensis]
MLTVLLDCLVTALGATNIAPPFLTWTSNILLLLGPICLVITGAGSRGVWSTKHAYLRSWSGWLDCIFLMNISADVLYCFGVGAGWWTHSSGSLAFLAILRNARAWVLLRICRTFRSAISQLARSAKDLVAVCVLVLVFSVLVLIVLLHFYGFTCWYRCYPDLPLPAEVQASDSCSADSFFWDVDESQFRFCSDKSPCREGTQCRNLFLYSVTSSCTAEDRRLLQDRAWRELQTNEEAAFGVIGLHTLGAAAVTILQGFTLEGWALTMQRQVDGDHSSAGVVAYIAFPALVVVGGMFLMNLAIAVLWEAFDAAKAEQATRPAILREAEWRVYQLLGTDWIKYLMVQLSQNWETASKLRSPLLPITEDFKAEADYELVKEGKPTFRERLCALRRQADRAVEFQFPQLKNRLQFLYAEVTAFSFRIATHRFTPLTMLTVVAIDTVSLLAEGGTDTSIMYTTIYILTSVVFVFEALVLVLAFGRQGLKDGFICLDILMACLTVVDGVYALAKCPHLSGCRTTMVETDGVLMSIGVVFSLMRPFRLFKLVKYFPPLRMTAEMLWVLHSALLPYVLLLIYSCAVMAQLGLFLFFDSKYLSVHSEGASLSVTKYLNFENPGNALLLLAAILTGEGWDLFFREFAQVYGREWTEFTFDSGQLSDFVLSGAFRVTAINTFLYIALLALNCVIFNLYGAVMIGQFIRTQKSLTVKHVANFIATCRNAGIKMPAEDALQGKNAQALYAVVDMSTDAQRDELIKAILLGSDHDKSAKAFGEFARKTSLAFDICKRVALKSNRLATRNSFGSISWTGDRHSSRSYSDIPVLSDKPNNKGLINDTGFDRAVAGHDLDHTLENSVTATSGISGRHSIAVLEKNKEETVPRGRINNSGALLHLDYLLVESRKLDIATKAAVQFVEGDETRSMPASCAARSLPPACRSHGSEYMSLCRAAPGAGENKSAEELQFRELCSMFWSAVRDAIRQGRIALIEAAKVGLAQITPIDPHSVALQMAYVSHLVSDPFGKQNSHTTSSPVQRDNPANTSGFSSLAELRSKSGSATSITLRRRSQAHTGMQQRKPERQMPSWMHIVLAKWHAALKHLRNVCGINGFGWLQLLLQIASLVELIIECAMKKSITSWKMHTILELGFQLALTADIFLRLGISSIREGIPFFSSRCNCLESVAQALAWCWLIAALSVSKGKMNELMFQSSWYRFAQCTRVLRCIWLLRLWKGTGTHRLVLAMQVAGRRILNLGFIFVLLLTCFAVSFRYLLGPVAGEPPSVYLAYANITSLSESFLSVFILTTSEGWPSLLTRILDLGDRHHVLTIILCSLVIALLSVFVMNLFVGVIVDVLEKEQANLEYTGGVRSATVLRWNEVQRAIFNSSAAAEVTKRRGGMMRAEGLGARDWLSQIIASKQVDLAVAIVSVASCLSLTATGAWAETSLRWRFPSFQNWIFWANAIFVVAYIIEQCFRALVLRKSLFEKGIYVFDFAIALLSLVALIIALSTSLNTAFPAGPLWPVGFRMVRVAYVICHRLPVMHVISITMLNVFAALRRVLLVLGGIILFYGLLGTCLFYDAPIDPKLHFTFASLLDSILLLMSCCTGENWHDIMLQGRAFYYKEGDAVLGWSIMVYSVTFTIVAFLLLMNVFMSTVLKGYVDAKRNQSLWKVAQQHNELMNKWRLREMKLSWLPIHVAVQVLTEIPAPIGYKNLYCEMGSRRMHAILASLAAYSLPIRNNSVHIRDVVLTTTCRACEAHAQNKETPIVVGLLQQRQAVELNPRFVSTWMKRFSDISGTASEFTVLHYLAALNIQAFWRTRRLLERNTATEQLMYMKHLLFLLETAAPICARRSERTDHRRSTLRRKRGIKGGGSIVRMSTALSRRGTFARPPKLSQPKERMKSALKRAVRGQSPRNNESEQISSSSSRRTCQSRLLQDEKLDHHSQRERPKSVRRGTVSEYIISLAEDHTRTASDHTGTLGKASAAQLSQEGQNTLFLRDSARASFTGKCDSRASSRSEPDSTTGLTASGAAPQIPVAGSSSTMRYSMVSGADSGYLSNEYPFTTHPTANAPPRRSNMRPSQPFLEPPPRRSLHRVSSSTRLHQQSFTDAGQANVIVPTRRRGQSVQFTGVERRELQHLLTPALVADDSSDFDKDEGGKTSLSKFAA